MVSMYSPAMVTPPTVAMDGELPQTPVFHAPLPNPTGELPYKVTYAPSTNPPVESTTVTVVYPPELVAGLVVNGLVSVCSARMGVMS